MDRTPVVLLRRAQPDDLAGIRDFVCALSPRSQYFRFFAAVAPPSTGLLHALCGTGRADVLLITDGHGGVIGHGMAADESAGEASRAEVPGGAASGGAASGGAASADSRLESSIGLVVADAWQRRGIGSQLLAALVSRAHSRGAGGLVLEVLPDNEVMLGIIRRRWPEAPSVRTPDAIVFRPAIHDAGLGWQPVPRLFPVGPPGGQGGERVTARSAA